MSGLRLWEWYRLLTDTWAANTPCWASLGELGWEGCTDEEVLLSSCGLSPPAPAAPAAPPQQSPPPPQTHPNQKAPHAEAQVL